LLAAVLFRRNIGAEVSLFTGVTAIPQQVGAWYTLLQEDPFIGLAFLAVFDVANDALVGLVFLALAAAFWEAHKSAAAIALASGMVGIAVGFASNISLTMLSLSQQYTSATTEAQRTALLSAGQAVLAADDPLAVYPATGVYVSLVLIALAGLLFASVMLRHSRVTAIVGLVASACDLAYCLTFALMPLLPVYLFLAVAGLFWMIWHLLVARLLLGLSKE